MSYSIIFQTKIVKLDDNRIIHFDRSGCNNDTAGREKNLFTAQLYNADWFEKKAKGYMENSKPYKGGDFELKIGSRYCTVYDYGKHLLTMLKRAENFEQFKKNNFFRATLYKGIEVQEPFHKTYLNKECPEIESDIMFRKGDFEGIREDIRCRRIFEYFDNIDDCINLIENNEPMEFFIKKKAQFREA